jgi:hypothetical protein
MATSTISQQELQQNYAAAEEATHAGPVVITRDGEPRSVLIDIVEYRKLTGSDAEAVECTGKSLAELLAVPEDEYFEWEPPRLEISFRPADLD